jgi:hypothetical protein
VDEASALNLEAIEKFIGQKIPVEWADDDLYLPEIKPTAEERRRYADERRARLAARERVGDRGRREHGRGGPERRRHEPARHEPPRHAEARPPAPSPPPAPEGAGGEARRRRRRRRRRGGGPRPEGPPQP